MTLSGTNIQFSLLESVHRIISPVQTIPTLQTYPESYCIHEKQSGRASTPLDVYFLPTQTARLPHGVFSTRICASNRSASADTWEIIPTMQSWPESCCNSCIAFSNAISSKEPKPSSMNIALICTQPLCCCTASESPNASDSDAKNVSPPDSVFTSRSVPVY